VLLNETIVPIWSATSDSNSRLPFEYSMRDLDFSIPTTATWVRPSNEGAIQARDDNCSALGRDTSSHATNDSDIPLPTATEDLPASTKNSSPRRLPQTPGAFSV
jgi:hypothetical protein